MSHAHKSIVIYCKDIALQSKAIELGNLYGFSVTADLPIAHDFYLEYSHLGLALHSLLHQNYKPLLLNFSSGKTQWRRLHGGGKNQAIAKAVGLKAHYRPSIIDATAGLAQDSFVLASLGCEVWMIERSPIIAALLKDALNRASLNPEIAEIISRMHLYHGEAQKLIPLLPPVDTIYLDPMFPHEKKSALVKKEMQILQVLLGESNESSLLALALAHSKRVTVKRPKNGPLLDNLSPTYQMLGSSNRFDIYLAP